MSASSPRTVTARPARRPGAVERVARRLVERRLSALRGGRIKIHDADGARVVGAGGELPDATLRVIDPRCYTRSVLAGSIGFAESYLRGEWEPDDLALLLRVFARDVARHRAGSWTHAAFARPLLRLGHLLRRNTRAGSRRNIREHYDLGNAFYRLFLDDTMTYSCAVFTDPAATLREASIAKLDLACRKLGLGPEHHVLEIGTGWGSFAIHAARHYGCRVTTTTISPAQRELAVERIRAAGLERRVEVLARDYRDLEGTFDRLVSIEMIEAVGHEHLPAFFRACSDRLRPDGAMLLQAITMPDRDYDAYRDAADFIQRYVFPGSSLPSLGAMTVAVADHTDFRIDGVESIGLHYAETLRRWRAAFEARLPEVRSLGFDERFVRLWRYYLCYCEAGFEERYVDDLQLVLAKPAWRGAAGDTERATAVRAVAAREGVS